MISYGRKEEITNNKSKVLNSLSLSKQVGLVRFQPT